MFACLLLCLTQFDGGFHRLSFDTALVTSNGLMPQNFLHIVSLHPGVKIILCCFLRQENFLHFVSLSPVSRDSESEKYM